MSDNTVIPKRFVFVFALPPEEMAEDTDDYVPPEVYRWWPLLAGPGVVTGELSDAEHEKLIRGPLNSSNLENSYGVHDVSFIEATDLWGYTTYEVDAERIDKLMNAWAGILKKGGFSLGPQIEARVDGSVVTEVGVVETGKKIDLDTYATREDLETALNILLEHSGLDNACQIVIQILNECQPVSADKLSREMAWKISQAIMNHPDYRFGEYWDVLDRLIGHARDLRPAERKEVSKWFLNHPDKEARIRGAKRIGEGAGERAKLREENPDQALNSGKVGRIIR